MTQKHAEWTWDDVTADVDRSNAATKVDTDDVTDDRETKGIAKSLVTWTNAG